MSSTRRIFLFIALPLVAVFLLIGYFWITDVDNSGQRKTGDGRTQYTIDCQPPDEHQWYRTDNTFLIDHKNPDTLYVSVEWKGFFKSVDGGETWTKVVNGIFSDHIDKVTKENCYGEYPAAVMDPENPNRILLATSGSPGTLKDINSQGGGIYETTDGGESWTQKIRNDMNVYSTRLGLAFKPGDTQTYYYGTSAAPASYNEADQTKIFVTKGIIYQTTDNGQTWTELETGFIKNARLMSIMVHPSKPDTITAATAVINRNIEGPNDIAAQQMGIIQTTDGGKTWKRVDNLPVGYEGSQETKAAPSNGDNMFHIPMIQGDDNLPKAFYSLDGGKTWLESAKHMDSVSYDPHDLSGKRLLGYSWQCMGECQKTLWQSLDAGKSWQSFGTLPSEIKNIMDQKTRVQNIVWHPTNKSTFFMTGAGGLVWKTTDNGSSWNKLLDYGQL